MFSLTQSITIALILLHLIANVCQAAESGKSELQQESEAAKQNETIANGRSMEQSIQSPDRSQRTRSGRMMDLDHLVGAINKEEKTAKDRSITGNRQSRILSEDILSPIAGSQPTKGEARSKKSGKKSASKKMAIKGFIPIVSLEGHKGGNPLEDEEEDDESGGEEAGQQQPQQQHQQQQQGNPDQLLAGYGSQTSMGHASFVSSASEASPQQHQQWQHIDGLNQDHSEAARARKLLHGAPSAGNGLLDGLSAAPKRFLSTLVPGKQPFGVVGPSQMVQGPMNIPLHSTADSSVGECICVPFFQCQRNGYLSPNQLSRSQLQQISAAAASAPVFMNRPMQPTAGNFQQAHMHQVPRALKSSNDLYTTGANLAASMNNNQQQYDFQQASEVAQAGNFAPTSNQPDNQQALNEAYEQLKKTMESENIEQLLLQQQQQQTQMMNLPLLDERSKAGGQQSDSAASNSSETQERSLLNPLANRRSSAQKSCGIMRTCCKIPPTLMGGLNRGPQAQRFLQQQQPDFQQHITRGQQFHPRPQTTMISLQQQQQHQQSFQPQQFADSVQPVASVMASTVQSQFHQQQQSLANRPIGQQQQQPMGSFMAGRCGIRNALGVAGRVQNAQPAPGSETTAEFGEFPSHAAILKRLSPGDSLFVCSAVLISNQWLATAAHCIKRYRADEIKVRLGEWDVQNDDEFYPFVELNVRQIVVHPDFQSSSLINDLALLRLDSAGLDPQQMPHIAPACLATPDEVFARSRCWLTGWGKDAFGQAGSFQSVLKKVDLPVMDRQQCESALRYQTKLGKYFRLHQSALCAGGERGKDACEGDGGSGLYCTDPESGLTKVVGLVSWGVGCGQVGVPGIYTNLGLFYSWIESVVGSSGEENLYMDRNSANSIPENVFKSLVSERSNQAAATNATLSLSQEPAENSNSTVAAAADRAENSATLQSGDEVESRAGRRRR